MSLLTDRLKEHYRLVSQTQPDAITVPFGPWLPDLPALGNPGCTVARNVIPGRHSYRPLGALTAATDALDARCKGGVRARDATGNYFNYAGTASKLYEVRATAVTDKSKAGGYSTATDDLWEFAQWRDQLMATNYTDPVQVITIGAAGNFADLFTSTEKPKAKHVGVVGQFAVFGNINSNSDGVKPNRVHWTAFGDITDADPDSQTQSDFEDRATGGAVQAIVGGLQYGIVIQESTICRMTYPAGDAIFSIDEIDRRRGTPLPAGVIGHGRFVYFPSEEGFFMTDGTQSYPIGDDQVDETFWKQFDIGNAALVSAAIDPLNKLYAIAFPGEGGVGKIFFYHWKDRQWSEAEVPLETLVNTTSESLTLEDLDAIYANLESIPVSLDSPQFRGGGLLFGAFNEAHKLAYFDGDALLATFETGEREMFPGRYAKVSKLRPLIDGGAVTASVAGRTRQVDDPVYGSSGAVDSIGEVGVLNESRYHRFRCRIASGGDWEHAQGVQVLASPMGTMGYP